MYQTISKELRLAAQVQPCPACKEDIAKLADIVDSYPNLRKEDKKTLKDLSYINEMSSLGKAMARFTSLFFLGKIPENIIKTIREDKQANHDALSHLLRAQELADAAETIDGKVKKVLSTYINMTRFKIECTHKQFWAFSKMLDIGFKTHILQLTAKIITLAKALWEYE